MPTLFKGTEVHFRSIQIVGMSTGAQIIVEVQFVDGEGLTHATTRHTLEPSIDQKVADAVRVLHDALRAFVEERHYTDANSSPGPGTERVTPRGIAESLRDESDDSDESTSQG